jgi:hypothetical protein
MARQSNFLAGGNIYPARFVTYSGANTVTQAGAGNKVFGISQVGTNTAPVPEVTSQYAAQSGQQLEVFGDNDETSLELGGTVSAGDELKSDSNGKGVVLAGSGAENIGAVALEAGTSGQLIKVRVKTSMRYT